VHDHGAALSIKGLTKQFGSSVALDGVDLEVAPGEFMTLLGPSGSGKTTTLNVVAGFTQADGGEVFIDRKPLGGVPSHKRDIGVVFQNYALFPHMRVSANIAFPLKQRRVPKSDISRRVGEALEIVGLVGLSDRYPRELSGGQQQRVALARALVFQPKLLLLDEPLGALDKRLRESLQLEIKRIHREVGVTFVFVTHDQEEALAMSDRIAVFNNGGIEQVGSAQQLYEAPVSLFVAQFLGDSNIIEGRIAEEAGRSFLVDGHQRFEIEGHQPNDTGAALVIRPERVVVAADTAGLGGRENRLQGTIAEVVYLGSRRRLVVQCPSTRFLVDESAAGAHRGLGDSVWLAWGCGDGCLVPAP